MTIALKDNAGATVNYTFARDIQSANGLKRTFFGPSHSDATKDMLALTISDPKRVSDSFGNRRTTIAYYATVDVDTPDGQTGVKKDLKVEINVSLPVGATSSELLEACARIQEFITSESNCTTTMLNGGVLS
nr:MAG: hypothetical protein 2 [Leviviridae sp.]